MQDLLDRGRRYAETVFSESKRVDATALIETDQELITLTVPSSTCDDDEDARATFRSAVEQVIQQSKVKSVTIIAEVWFNVLPRFSATERPPMRNMRREALVVSVETLGQFSATLSEITRWEVDALLGPWREVSSLYLPGLTNFIPESAGAYVH